MFQSMDLILIRFVILEITEISNILMIDDINDTAFKINRANAMLFTVSEFVNIKIPKSICYPTFDCHLNYADTTWC